MNDPTTELPQSDAHDDYDAQPWDEHEQETLPGRPRRRLLTPITALLFAVLLGAGCFIAGVQVEKHQLPASNARAGRFAALGGAAGASAGAGSSPAGAAAGGRAGTATGARAAGGGNTGTGFAGGSTRGGFGAAGGAGAGAAGGGATIGQVANVSKSNLFVTDTQSNTIKVLVPGSSAVTKQITTSVKAVHPGDTVIVQGVTRSDGSIQATNVRDSGSAGASGGLGALFGGGSAGGSSSSTGGTGSSASGSGSGGAGSSGTNSGGAGGGPVLFGPGG